MSRNTHSAGRRLPGLLHPLLYGLTIAAAITLYASHTALVEGADVLSYLGIVLVSVSLVVYGQVILHRVVMGISGYHRNNIAVSMPLALIIQALLVAILIKWRNTPVFHPVLHNRVYLALTVLAVLVVASFLSVAICRRLGVAIRTRTPVRAESTLALLVIAAIAASMYFPAAATGEKNVVLISVDSWRYDHRSSVTPELVTPNVAELENVGITYDNFQAHAPYTWTALSSLMTSQESPFHGVRVNGHVLKDDQLTLSEVLGTQGYRCFAAADIDLPTMGLDQGFETHSGLRGFALFSYYGFNLVMSYAFPGFFERHCFATNNSMTTTIGGLEFLRQARGGKFFMWLHYYDEPHIPYVAPDCYVDIYNSGRNSWVTDDPAIVYALRGKPKYLPAIEGRTMSPTDIEVLQGFYQAEVTAMDRQLGMVLSALKKNGLFENTLIVLTADHGEDFGERGQFLHGSNLYHGLLHVPLVIKLPNSAAPGDSSHVTDLTRAIDVAPTILTEVGVAVPEGFHGHDIVPRSGASDVGAHWSFAETMLYGMYWPFDKYAFSYTDDRYKYIALPLEEQQELYDLAADPGETVNIADTHPEVIERIRADLMEYFETDDIFGLVPLDDARLSIGEKQMKMLRALGYID